MDFFFFHRTINPVNYWDVKKNAELSFCLGKAPNLSSRHFSFLFFFFYCGRTTEADSNSTDDTAELGDTFPPMRHKHSGKTNSCSHHFLLWQQLWVRLPCCHILLSTMCVSSSVCIVNKCSMTNIRWMEDKRRLVKSAPILVLR